MLLTGWLAVRLLKKPSVPAVEEQAVEPTVAEQEIIEPASAEESASLVEADDALQEPPVEPVVEESKDALIEESAPEEVVPPSEEIVSSPETEVAPVEEEVAPAITEAPPVEEVAAPEPEVPVKVSLFERMRAGLAKTQASLVGRIDALLSSSQSIDEDLMEELEEVLVTADFGMQTTMGLMQSLEERISAGEAADPQALRGLLKDEIRQRLRLEAAPLDLESSTPYVIMVVGVNGVGKTTTIGKLAHQFVSQGKTVLLGAGDTFRAAAAEQLTVWGERAGVEVIRQESGSDPAAVAFDAAKAAVARKADVLILDTAGRLHTKVNLMEELKKIRRVLDREIPGAPHETLLVVDATTGQNALVQARLFQEAVEVSGLALTKLDGTARGGMLVAIGNELGLPVRYVGIGEGMEDLRPFDPDLFVEALFEQQG
ncbi:signal recognition particle-docking protein FtsY [Syntrophotalea acetylenivorans]|uniref:Signal recognition particle receptor FtsY n=1 Tax=Syntrophotalea acetylenivorans TaxID=1842532 RepID=A0A1L3GTC4_9BACT|nr:signal recognition particle-docking protein FtsY [Syntrophotalea acetylenivorans]